MENQNKSEQLEITQKLEIPQEEINKKIDEKTTVPTIPEKINSKPKKKKRGCLGCLGCFGQLLLLIIILIAAFFIGKAIFNKVEENKEKELAARFSTEVKLSSENKLNSAYNKGEITTDFYILQTAYSIYDTSKLEKDYKSDVEFSPPADIISLFETHFDELSDETKEYILNKLFLTDVVIDTKETTNSSLDKNIYLPSSRVNASFYNNNFLSKTILSSIESSENTTTTEDTSGSYDLTILDKAVLSKNKRFLIWYTETGDAAVDRKDAIKMANEIEDISEKVSKFFGEEWSYEPWSNLDKLEITDMVQFDLLLKRKKVLDDCGIDFSALNHSFNIYLYNSPKSDTSLARYTRKLDKFYETLNKLMISTNVTNEQRAQNSKFANFYSIYTPFITVQSDQTSDFENFSGLLAHELTHHFQQLYYEKNNAKKSVPLFTSETVANLVAASVTDSKSTNIFLNSHSNYFTNNLNAVLTTIGNGEELGYVEFIWAKSYIDKIENGFQYLKESLMQENPYQYLLDKAGDNYKFVIEDLSEKLIIKNYDKNGFKSNYFPVKLDNDMLNDKENKVNYFATPDHINTFSQNKDYDLNKNSLNYHYISQKDLKKNNPIIHITCDTLNANVFVKVYIKTKKSYELIDTIYFKDKTTVTINGKEKLYQKCEELILCVGNTNPYDQASYDILAYSEAVYNFFDEIYNSDDYFNFEADTLTLNIDEIQSFVSNAKPLLENTSENDKEVDDLLDEQAELAKEINKSLLGFLELIEEPLMKFNVKKITIQRIALNEIVDETDHDKINEAVLKMFPHIKLRFYRHEDSLLNYSFGLNIPLFTNSKLALYGLSTGSSKSDNYLYILRIEE